MNLTDEDVTLLNSPIGLSNLLSQKTIDLQKTLEIVKYEIKLKALQAELVELQNWVIEGQKKIVIVFQGRDAAGKGGAIRRLKAHINPRHYRVVALPKPTEEEKGQWYFQRYVNKLPKPGEIVFFDRSWYNRAIVEPVNEFCTQQEYHTFMGQVNDFERMLTESGTFLIKFYLSITKEEQARRFEDIKQSPLKRWKMTPLDLRAQEMWEQYTVYREKMIKETNTAHAPWTIIEADRKTVARVAIAEHILKTIPYNTSDSR